MTEKTMTPLEIDLIKKKVSNSNIFIIIFCLIFLGLLNFAVFSIFEGNIKYMGIIVSIILFIIILNNSSRKMDESKKDLLQKRKIIETVKVIDKYTNIDSHPDSYSLIFDSKTIKRYKVNRPTFNSININDSVYIEYSKFGHWILKIEHNGKSIINQNMIN